MRIFARLLGGLVVIVVAAGCTSHSAQRRSFPTTVSSTASGSSKAPTRPVGIGVCSHEGLGVDGTLRMVGGPSSARPQTVPGTVTATRVATAGSPPYSCSVSVGPDGNFTFVLAPGTYRFTGRSPKFDGGRVDCVADGNVVIFPPSGNGTLPNGQSMFASVDCQRR